MTKKISFAILVIFILLGCRTDITDTNNETSSFEKKKYFITKSEISNQLVIGKLNLIQNKSLNSLNSVNKNGDENVLEGRIILDRRILVVEDENQQKSYTFSVRNIKDSTSALENLVIIPNKNSYRAFILRYNVDEEERRRLVRGEKVDNIFAKTELIDVDYNKINLPISTENKGGGGETTTTTYHYGCVKLTITHFDAYTCEYCDDWTTWEIDVSGCSGGGGGSGSGGGEGSGGGGGGTSGGGATPIEEDAPDFEEEYENVVVNFRNQLSPSQLAWFVDTDNKYIGMELATIYNLYNTPQVFNFLASLIDNVNNTPSNIIFMYQAKNYLNIKGVNASTTEVVTDVKNAISLNGENYDFSDWVFNYLIQNNDVVNPENFVKRVNCKVSQRC